MARDLVSVWFHNPVSGMDVEDGFVFISNRHKILASWAQQDGLQTKFLDDEGEIIAQWSTVDVSHIEWPTGNKVVPSENEFKSRMEEIKKLHSNAWSKWTAEEVLKLQSEFSEYKDIKFMTDSHQRAPGGITSKLKSLGFIPEDYKRNEAINFINDRAERNN
jgi:hypothetical protein